MDVRAHLRKRKLSNRFQCAAVLGRRNVRPA
jgi:hypothetical protein